MSISTNSKNSSKDPSSANTWHNSILLEGSPVRTIDTRSYVSVLRDLIREGREVSMNVSGSSMAPFLIHNRDRIIFRAPDRELKRGDIVFYERDGGQFVCHRIYRTKIAQAPDADNNSANTAFDNQAASSLQPQYYMVGDNQTKIEGPLRRDQIFAIITKVNRKGKWYEPGDFWWDFFAKVWIRIVPLRRPIITLYAFATRRSRVSEPKSEQNKITL